MDNTPYQSIEPINRYFYPLRSPSSITYATDNNSLVFADTDNNRIMRISLFDGNIYYLVANAAGIPFAEGIGPLGMAPVKPRVVDYNPMFNVPRLGDYVYEGRVTLVLTGAPDAPGETNNAGGLRLQLREVCCEFWPASP